MWIKLSTTWNFGTSRPPPQTRERFSYNGFDIFRFFEFPAFSCINRSKLTPESCSVGINTSIIYFWVFFDVTGFRDEKFKVFLLKHSFQAKFFKRPSSPGGGGLEVLKFSKFPVLGQWTSLHNLSQIGRGRFSNSAYLIRDDSYSPDMYNIFHHRMTL